MNLAIAGAVQLWRKRNPNPPYGTVQKAYEAIGKTFLTEATIEQLLRAARDSAKRSALFDHVDRIAKRHLEIGIVAIQSASAKVTKGPWSSLMDPPSNGPRTRRK